MTIHLSVLLWLPLAAGVVGLFLPGRASRWAVLLGSLLTLAYAIAMLVDYDHAKAGLQFVTDDMWISQLGIHYKLGVDGLNVVLLALTAILFLGAFAWASRQEIERPKLFWFWFALMQTGVLGAFLAQDLILFVAFFDLMLVPVFFLTGQWGGENRQAAIVKLFIYTLAGSLLMLAAAVATGVMVANESGNDISFALTDLAATPLGKGSQEWIFLCFAAAFLVKMPAFPFHGWMPDGYKAMPIAVLAVFSAILSKVAAYGFLRVVLPVFPDASVHFQMLMLLLALGAILYGSAMAFTVTNARLVLGYSSIAQLGFIVLGIFALQQDGAQGAILQMVNHGLVVAPLFFVVALLAARAGSEDLRDMGGLAFRAPILATIFLVFILANLAIPGSSNFAGEFLILLAVFKSKLVISIIAFTGVVMASVYSLRAYIRSMHNRVGPNVDSRELSLRDGVVLVPLALVTVALALYPQFALKRSDATTAEIVQPARVAAGLVKAQPIAATDDPVIVPDAGGTP
jgi:NADH-quinone oxidoreductase subunit M